MADAEALVAAAQRPGMRFVGAGSEDRQARALLSRGRERPLHQRTGSVHALRSNLCDHGHIVPRGLVRSKRIARIVDDPDSGPPELIREECRDPIGQIADKTPRIDAGMRNVRAPAAKTHMARRPQTLPGVGPLIALAVEAFAPDMAHFRRDRDPAAWPGLVPRRHSSGGKARLGSVSKAGQTDLRGLPVIGAMSRLNRPGRKSIPKEHGWRG